MPNPTEVARIVAGGQIYEYWQSIEIERLFGTGVSYMRFTAAEPGNNSTGWAGLRLMPGDPAQGYLAGQLAISGVVETRQVAYDAKNHAVEIIVASYTQNTIASTVDGTPGQYLNSTFQQIANAVCGPVGVTVKVDGVAGADKPFERVSEHIGETRFQFLERLARMRNLHPCDDSSGALVFGRGSTGGGAMLVEGRNILKGRILLRNQWAVSQVTTILQQHGNDQHWGDDARDISATVPNPAYSGTNRPLTIVGEQPGDQQDAQMRANHEMNLNDLTICEALITVQGWLMDDGSLWINHLREPITIQSPMLVPVDTFSLLLRGVKHMQDSENGTTTELNLCIPSGLGNDVQVNIPGLA
jgi:prophage tail gpP-like protein